MVTRTARRDRPMEPSLVRSANYASREAGNARLEDPKDACCAEPISPSACARDAAVPAECARLETLVGDHRAL